MQNDKKVKRNHWIRIQKHCIKNDKRKPADCMHYGLYMEVIWLPLIFLMRFLQNITQPSLMESHHHCLPPCNNHRQHFHFKMLILSRWIKTFEIFALTCSLRLRVSRVFQIKYVLEVKTSRLYIHRVESSRLICIFIISLVFGSSYIKYIHVHIQSRRDVYQSLTLSPSLSREPNIMLFVFEWWIYILNDGKERVRLWRGVLVLVVW